MSLENELVDIVTRNLPHVINARTLNINQNSPNLPFTCEQGSPVGKFSNQMTFGVFQTSIGAGDSGAPILDGAGSIVGMVNWQDNDPTTFISGGGTQAPTIRQVLGFDRWYGTESVNDNTFGVWRIHSTLGTGFWSLDNGDGRWNGCVWGSTQTTEDKDLCLQVGLPGDQPITGDWLNTGIKQIGIVRPSTGLVYQDLNHNGWDGCGPDHCTTFVEMEAEDLAVAGDWDGNGTAAVGIWNPFTGFWRLDNGNGVWNECGGFPAGDACGTFGGDGDRPIVWNQSVIKAN